MKRFILGLAALAGLSGAMFFGGPVQAGPHPGHPGPKVHPVRPVHAEARFIRHRGFDRCLVREYHSWSRYYWSPRFRCYFYFSPEANSYYYWYAPDAIYLPVSALATYTPTVVVNVGAQVPVPPPPLATVPVVPPTYSQGPVINPQIPMVPPPPGY